MGSSILAIEFAARTFPGDPFRRALHEIIRPQATVTSRAQRRYLYSRAVHCIGMNWRSIERGCWDYFDDNDKAVADFDMWLKGMTTEEGVRHQPSHDPPPRYLTFTMAFLLVSGSPTDLGVRARCNIPQNSLWRRDVFHQVLHVVTAIDFAHVRSDVAYLIPGDDAFALTPQDLAQQKFHYLRQLV